MRYEDCDEAYVKVFMKVLEERFPMYGALTFRLVFDLKKRVKEGKICLASIETASAKIKYFSKNKVDIEGCDYVLTVDKKCWDNASDEDRERLISHELRHVFLDEHGKCKLVGHDINDFAIEVELNKDDPTWNFKLGRLTTDIYEQEKDMLKAARKGDL